MLGFGQANALFVKPKADGYILPYRPFVGIVGVLDKYIHNAMMNSHYKEGMTMYAEVTSFKVKPEFVAESPKQTEKFVALHKSLKGFKSQTFLFDEESREVIVLSLWETKEDLDAALAVCIPEFQKASNMLDGEPSLKVYEVAYKD